MRVRTNREAISILGLIVLSWGLESSCDKNKAVHLNHSADKRLPVSNAPSNPPPSMAKENEIASFRFPDVPKSQKEEFRKYLKAFKNSNLTDQDDGIILDGGRDVKYSFAVLGEKVIGEYQDNRWEVSLKNKIFGMVWTGEIVSEVGEICKIDLKTGNVIVYVMEFSDIVRKYFKIHQDLSKGDIDSARLFLATDVTVVLEGDYETGPLSVEVFRKRVISEDDILINGVYVSDSPKPSIGISSDWAIFIFERSGAEWFVQKAWLRPDM